MKIRRTIVSLHSLVALLGSSPAMNLLVLTLNDLRTTFQGFIPRNHQGATVILGHLVDRCHIDITVDGPDASVCS